MLVFNTTFLQTDICPDPDGNDGVVQVWAGAGEGQSVSEPGTSWVTCAGSRCEAVSTPLTACVTVESHGKLPHESAAQVAQTGAVAMCAPSSAARVTVE